MDAFCLPCRAPPSPPLFPYTTLFRSVLAHYVEGKPLPPRAALITFDDGYYDNLENAARVLRSEEHTSELQSRLHLVCRLRLEKKKPPPCRSLPWPWRPPCRTTSLSCR